MKKSITFYNILFPIWFLMAIPITWLIVLPVNFVVDSLVVLLGLKLCGVEGKKSVYWSVIFKVWVFGFISDIAGCAFMLISQLINGHTPFHKWFYENITAPAAANPFETVFGIIFVIIAIAIAAGLIYLLNYRFSFKNSGLTKAQIKKIAIMLAVITAPYLFFIPSQWIR